MNAQIQSVTEDVDAGETEITIGPAKHLGGDDLLEQLRAAQNWVPGAFRNERLTAEPEGPAQSDGIKDKKGEGYGAAPDVPKLAWKVGDYTVTIDLKDVSGVGTIPSNLTLKPTVEQRTVSVGGVCTVKNVLSIISDPF